MNELDAIMLVRRRGILMQSTGPAGEGAMAAVLGLDAKKIEEILESFENVWIANYNCPGQIVITGLASLVPTSWLQLYTKFFRYIIHYFSGKIYILSIIKLIFNNY